MGNTSTSLHLVKPAADTRGMKRHIEAAYALLGYAPATNAAETPKRVALAEHGRGGEFLSIHDSDNALIDSGELKQLAVSLSKRLKTSAVLTSIHDSDRFEFVVFNKGKQVDAVVSDPDDHAAGLKMLKPGKRASTWKEIFLAPAALRALSQTGTPVEMAARFAAVMELERAFEQAMQRVGKIESAFAEDGLAACCEAAGLDMPHVLRGDQATAGDTTNGTVLTFEKMSANTTDQTVASSSASHDIRLALFISDDDWKAPRYYPAAWPAVRGRPTTVSWLVTSSGAGFSGLRLRFAFSNAAYTLTGKLDVTALPFYNGQITSSNPIASFEQPAPTSSPDHWNFDVAPFVIPDVEPQTRKQIMLLVQLELAGLDTEAVGIHPTLTTVTPAPIELALPPAKLRATTATWVPRIAQGAAKLPQEAILKLNEPAVFSMTALIDDTPAALPQVRRWAEAWLASLAVPVNAGLSMKAQKHMSASFRVAKSEKTVPLQSVSGDKQWPKLFDPKSQYQSVMIRIMLENQAFPVAAFTCQAALRDGMHAEADQSLKHVRDTIGPYLRAGDRARHLDNDGGTALAVSVWVLNDPAVFEVLGMSADNLALIFDDWMTQAAPIQAWVTRAAWIPEFDFYEEFNQTLYEQASAIDWFRSHMNGMLARRAWCCRRLRFVAPTMWLGKALAAPIDKEQLASIADLSAGEETLRIRLHQDVGLDRLESMLSPILPAKGEV